MNKRQRKKAVMRNISNLYDVVFERNRFRKNAAIIGARGPQGEKILATMLIDNGEYEYIAGRLMGISLEGYATSCQIIERVTND